jgi:hypothetical protein
MRAISWDSNQSASGADLLQILHFSLDAQIDFE